MEKAAEQMELIVDVNQPTLSKRWLGYLTECGLLASFALLVSYKCRPQGGVIAFVYETGDRFEGDTLDVLEKLFGVIDAEYEKKMGMLPPPADHRFFTQCWQKETRTIADGELFYIQPSQKENYVPRWKR
ncbi:TPA: hypothetical protein I7144_20635 [Vibrio vulnificus]|nr:hypothetical protein [Vibrio vulnificus]